MTEVDSELILQGAKENYPLARLRVISDNGPQFIANAYGQNIQAARLS